MKAIALIFGAVLLRLLFVSPFMLLFWWIRRSTRKLRPRENGASVEFSLAPRMHVLIEIVTVSLVAFTALTMWETVRKREGLYAALIPVSVLVAILLAEPRTVLINHEGIRQRRWLRGDRVRLNLIPRHYLSCNRNIFEGNALERVRIAQPFHGVEDLNSRQTTVRVKVRGYAFSEVLGRNRGFLEADVECIYILVVGDSHDLHL
ncbi:MAG: hypothetical protein WB562_14145 [Candidatus Sulfotelmatobacter sp.]